MAAKLASKLSLATIRATGKIVTVPDKDGNKMRQPIAIFKGAASGTGVKTMPNGDAFEYLKGDFEGIHLGTGEVFHSGVLYLPGGIHEAILEAVRSAVDENGKRRTITFELRIDAYPAANLAGFSYEAVPLVDAAYVDPFEQGRIRTLALAGFVMKDGKPVYVGEGEAQKLLAGPDAGPHKSKKAA